MKPSHPSYFDEVQLDLCYKPKRAAEVSGLTRRQLKALYDWGYIRANRVGNGWRAYSLRELMLAVAVMKIREAMGRGNKRSIQELIPFHLVEAMRDNLCHRNVLAVADPAGVVKLVRGEKTPMWHTLLVSFDALHNRIESCLASTSSR